MSSNRVLRYGEGLDTELRTALWVAQKQTCYYCMQLTTDVRETEIDHLFPKSGSKEEFDRWRVMHGLPTIESVDDVENLAVACTHCNREKSKAQLTSPAFGRRAKLASERAESVVRRVASLRNPTAILAGLQSALTTRLESEEAVDEFVEAVRMLAVRAGVLRPGLSFVDIPLQGRQDDGFHEVGTFSWTMMRTLESSVALRSLEPAGIASPRALASKIWDELSGRCEAVLVDLVKLATLNFNRSQHEVDPFDLSNFVTSVEPPAMLIFSEVIPVQGENGAQACVRCSGLVRVGGSGSLTRFAGADGALQDAQVTVLIEAEFAVVLTVDLLTGRLSSDVVNFDPGATAEPDLEFV